ncbi:ABC transporter permease [candidate division KSB1 bacterium]
MILIIKLAYRNVFRNFRRSLLTFLAISIGIAIALIFIGFSIGAERQSVKISVDTNTGHVKVHQAGYLDDELTLTLDHTIGNYREVLRKLGSRPDVESYAERILFPASLTDGIDELKLNGIGIHPDREHETFNIGAKLVQGSMIQPGDEKMLLTETIAKLFSVKPGDYLTLVARTKYGTINALDMEIGGLLRIGNAEVDNQYFFIPLDVAQEFLEMEDMVTEVTVMGTSMENADRIAAGIREILDGSNYDVVTWEYMARDLIRLYRLRAKARFLMNFILFLMASASVMNTMLMSIFERTSEIGTMMAMGFRKGRIMLLFIVEAMYLGIFGSLVGCVLGGAFTFYYKTHGIAVSTFFEEGMGNLPVGQYIYTEMTYGYLIAVFLLGIFIAAGSAAYPAYKGANMEPSDALRYV